MNIGNPIKAVPRYAKLFSEGIQGKPATLPNIGKFGAGQMDNSVYELSKSMNEHPLLYAGGTVGSLVLNSALGNPWGKLIDTTTFGLTDFDNSKLSKAEGTPIIEVGMMTPLRPPRNFVGNTVISGQSPMGMQPSYFPEQVQFFNIPQLDEAEKKRQIEYLQRKAATDLITINALKQQPGMEGYQ